MKFLPTRWEKFEKAQQCSSRTVSIHLETRDDKSESKFLDGWNIEEDYDTVHTVYARNGKAVFSLELCAPYEVTASAGRVRSGSLYLCIHYALMLALYRDCIGLHGVTLLCGNEIIILSAPSGTGKTTLSKLLEKHCDAIVINGDFALLTPTEKGVIFEPTPFCGTSGRTLNQRFRVNRVVFLSQAKTNEWRELTGREAMTQFMSNCFVPTWDADLQEAVQENILKCIGAVKVSAYGFAPTQEAAELFLKKIEGNGSPFSE